MTVLIVDFYDSFTYNLKHYVEPLCSNVVVVRDDELDLASINSYDKIILSPGPGLPENTKNMKNILKCYSGIKPILGVCLGMQGIAQYYGAELKQEYVTHGKKSKIKVDLDSVLFENTSEYIEVGLYHSWHIEQLNEEIFNSVSISEKGVLMAIESLELSLFGVQFHPESIMTPLGRTIIQNFLNYK